MPKYRQLHTKIIDSFDFNEMPDDFTRLVWVLLTLILDSEGRGIDDMNWVKSRMFPMRQDVTPAQLSNAFDWLAGRKMIVRYATNGRNYFYIPTFQSYQTGTKKEASSLLPPPATELQTSSRQAPEEVSAAESASASASVFESALSLNMEERPNVFKLYENEIGGLTKVIADKLIEAEQIYPYEWFAKAFEQSANHNKRSWAYAEAILKRYAIEGFNDNGKQAQNAPEIR